MALKYKIVAIFLLGCITQYNSHAQAKDALDSAIQKFSFTSPMVHASWGLSVIDMSDGSVYRSFNDHLSLMPASTLKTFTSAAALSLMGEDFRFKTTFAYSGSVDSAGVLNGNIYIIGGGDPTFGSWRFGGETYMDTIWHRTYRSLRELGITTVVGRVIADASIFEYMTVPPSWQWEDMGNYYGTGVAGLSIHENSVRYVFRPAKRIGDPAQLIRTEPEIPYLEVVNNVTTNRKWSGDQVYVYGSPYSNLRFLTGTVPYGPAEFMVSGSIPDPAFFAATQFSNFLNSKGMEVLFAPTTLLQMEWMGAYERNVRKPIYVHYSPPLKQIVYYVNMNSNNMYAEALVKMCGHHAKKEGTTSAGVEVVQEFWRKKGVNLSGLNQKDGSGLSRKNIITPRILTETLYRIKDEQCFDILYESLPVAGVSGSVKNMFKKSSAEGNMRAKSGTISGVKAYTGYLTNAGGKKLAFALIVNNYDGKHSEMVKLMEELLIAVSNSD
ncbi:MAG: D-alanyl-D-alanine carboxypeptidase/D-alanyl-D-alanine-endopeptidase [Bacteroidales bacterium]|nr:D-alanyl-D-alanine carboxypeptidase/D-alanyl-D-alanine-endopeptidase [Bacteroidales bacterium]